MDLTPLSVDDIRPYLDAEVPAVLERVIARPSFAVLMAYLYPNTPVEKIASQMRQVDSIKEFQHRYISRAIRNIVRDSIDELTHEGLDDLDPNLGYLFISNHRDIILDSGLLNVLRYELGYETTQIAIGDNLLISPMVSDLMKLNKSFIVHRLPPRQEIYAYSLRLSQYIRQTLTVDRSSVWIAQRNGRTKDGRDLTQAGLMKMLSLSAQSEDLGQAFAQLNLVPLAISYEYEPCDLLKAEENWHRKQEIPYSKDDKLAIIRGIRAKKGRVHLAAGKPISLHLSNIPSGISRNEWLRQLCQILDQEIHRLYWRWPIQYAAADFLHHAEQHASHYTAPDREKLLDYLNRLAGQSNLPQADIKTELLQIYAGMIPPLSA
ncbi:MAG: glycerol acyltransferase [Bacteroidota bacterium]